MKRTIIKYFYNDEEQGINTISHYKNDRLHNKTQHKLELYPAYTEYYYPSHKIRIIKRCKNGEYYSDDDNIPVYQYFHEDYKNYYCQREIFIINGNKHIKTYFSNGNLKSETIEYICDNYKETKTYYFSNSKIKIHSFHEIFNFDYKNVILNGDNVETPAIIMYDEDGRIISEKYLKNKMNLRNNMKLPTYIIYDYNNEKIINHYYKMNGDFLYTEEVLMSLIKSN